MKRSNFIYIERPDTTCFLSEKTDLEGEEARNELLLKVGQIDPTGFLFVGTKQEPGASADYVLSKSGFMGSTNHRFEWLDEKTD